MYNTFIGPIYNDKNKNHIPVVNEESNYEKIVELIQKHIKRQSICVFPEVINKQHRGCDLAKFRTGIFKIAYALGIPIVPVIFDHIPINKIGYIKDKPFKIALGPLVKPSHYKDVTPFIDDIRNWMQLKLSHNRK
jgi:1-acyl-sn-glycerol-3-phosphate acyltransferase